MFQYIDCNKSWANILEAQELNDLWLRFPILVNIFIFYLNSTNHDLFPRHTSNKLLRDAGQKN